MLHEYAAHVRRPVAVVNINDVAQRSRLVLDPLQFESARENHGALKLRLRGVDIGVVGFG